MVGYLPMRHAALVDHLQRRIEQFSNSTGELERTLSEFQSRSLPLRAVFSVVMRCGFDDLMIGALLHALHDRN